MLGLGSVSTLVEDTGLNVPLEAATVFLFGNITPEMQGKTNRYEEVANGLLDHGLLSSREPEKQRIIPAVLCIMPINLVFHLSLTLTVTSQGVPHHFDQLTLQTTAKSTNENQSDV